MKICTWGHSEIIFDKGKCPLCSLIEHNNQVHDFIESKGPELVQELVKYQKEKTENEK